MMTTVGLELTNFINPDLTWKTVAKGNRSATRRTRKQVAKNAAGEVAPADKSTKADGSTEVSDSEKLGVAVLGRRFTDKAEQVPIKKRRFMFRSPSPPPSLTRSPHLENSQQFVCTEEVSGPFWNSYGRQRPVRTDASTLTKFNSGVVHGETFELMDERNGCISDFSGIEILAAVACNSSMGDDIDPTQGIPLIEEPIAQEPNLLASGMPMEETCVSLGIASVSSDDMDNKDETKNSSFQNNPVDVSPKCPADEDTGMVEKSVSSRDNRSHWDLNLSMDAWGKPCDFGQDDSQMDVLEDASVNSSEKLQALEECEVQKVAHDSNHETVDGVVLSDEHGNIPICSDSTDFPVLHNESEREDHEFRGCSDVYRNPDECVLTPTNNAQEPVITTVSDGSVPSQIVSIDPCVDCAACPSNNVSIVLSEENKSISASNDDVTERTENGASGLELGKILCVESVPVEESLVDSPYEPVLGKVTCKIDSVVVNKSGGLYLEKGSVQERISVDTCQQLTSVSPAVEPVSKVEDICLPKCEDRSTSAVDDGGLVTVDAEGQADAALSVSRAESDLVAHVGSEELMQESSGNSAAIQGVDDSSSHEVFGPYDNGPASTAGEIALDGPFDDNCDSDVSQEDKEVVVSAQNSMEVQAGYDSQFEDGELREDPCWDENEREGGEIEHVDYESETDEERLCDLAESSDKKMEADKGLYSDSDDVVEKTDQCVTGDASRGSSVSLKTGTSEMTDSSKIKKHVGLCMEGSDIKDFPSRVGGFKASKRELLSRIEGSSSSDAIHRGRSDIYDDSCLRDERDAASDKFMARDRHALHVRGRSPGGGHFVNPSTGYWDSKRRHSPIYNSSYNPERPRPKSIIESRGYGVGSDHVVSGTAAVAGLDNHMRRQISSPSSNGAYRSLIRRKSPVDADDAYGMHTGILPMRDSSPDRSRFRRYPQGVGRGGRDIHRTIPEDTSEFSGRTPHRLARRERSVSPIGGGRPHHAQPYKKSRMRSRSRSPVAWHRTRSLNFRPDARMERVRLPFQKRFAADSEEDFISLPRNRFSPQRKSRWFDDRSSAMDNFRARKSPVRMFRQSQRFDSVRSIRRMNSDEYFRPVIRPRRFPDMAGGRGCKYEGSDDDKHGNRYEMIHRVRRYDTDGVVRRFRYNPEDSFVANDS